MVSVYIGAAIDSASSDPAVNFNKLSNAVVEALDNKVVIYNPLTAFRNASYHSKSTNSFIVEVNSMALLEATIAVFAWSDHPSFGVPVEISMRCQARKPVIIWDQSTKGPGIYMKHFTDKFGHIVVRDIGEFKAHLQQMADKLSTGGQLRKSRPELKEIPDAISPGREI